MKEITKRIRWSGVVFAIILFALPVGCAHTEPETMMEINAVDAVEAMFTWTIDDGCLRLSGEGDMPDYNRGETPWYKDRAHIYQIEIEDGITSIGAFALCDCSSLMSAAIPDSVVDIGTAAFRGCTRLTTVTFGSGLKRINDYAFINCTSLTHMTVPDGVEYVGNSAFANCSAIEEVELGAGLQQLGSWAFAGCELLSCLAIPEGTVRLGDHAFAYCYNLERVFLPVSIKVIGAELFLGCAAPININYAGTEEEWASVELDEGYNGYENVQNGIMNYSVQDTKW